MTFYAELVVTAHELLDEFGATVTLTRASGSAPTYDPATGVATPVAPAVYTGVGVRLEYDAREVDGSLVLSGDERVYLSTVDMVLPAPGDVIAFPDGQAWRVVRAGRLSPAGADVLYDVQVRR